MPAPLVKSFAKKYKLLEKDVEKYWEVAKQSALDQGRKEDEPGFYGLVVGILKKIVKSKDKNMTGESYKVNFREVVNKKLLTLIKIQAKNLRIDLKYIKEISKDSYEFYGRAYVQPWHLMMDKAKKALKGESLLRILNGASIRQEITTTGSGIMDVSSGGMQSNLCSCPHCGYKGPCVGNKCSKCGKSISGRT